MVLFINLQFAQSPPESFKYQAIVRDTSGNIIANQVVAFEFNIRQGSPSGPSVFQEQFNATTNGYGLVNLDIGTGTVISGDIATIDWSAGPYFIETGFDITGGTTFSIMSSNQLLSVPYALYAKSAGNSPPGADGHNSILEQTILASGDPNCPEGGVLIESGIDLDDNGVLDASEIDHSSYVCNGQDGQDDQNIQGSVFNPTSSQLTIGIENGNSQTIDLSSLNNSGTDDQNMGPATLRSQKLRISKE